MRGVLTNIEKDYSEAGWIDRLIYHEAGTFSDLRQQVEMQSSLLEGIGALNARLLEATSEGELADSLNKAEAALAKLEAIEGESFDDLWLADIRATMRQAHERSIRDGSALGVRTETGGGQGGGQGATSGRCVDEPSVLALLGAKLEQVRAALATDFAARESGGVVVFSNRLTSPSFPQEGQLLSGTMRHVLGLRAPFPPPDFVISNQGSMGDRLVGGGRGDLGGAAGSGLASEATEAKGDRFVAQCWAMGGTEGTFTVRLARPVKVTHVSLEQRPAFASSRHEELAAPKQFTVFGLTSPTDESPLKLGTFEYAPLSNGLSNGGQAGTPKQTFALPFGGSGKPVSLVTLLVRSNHGNPDYTCIHKFRVHSVS